jgi:hypothetical protein
MENSLVLLPLEMWLLIFQYTDNVSFNNILDFINKYDKYTHKTLMSLVCKDIVKNNKKIIAMIKLFQEPKHYRTKNNYLHFKNLWVNEVYNYKSVSKNHIYRPMHKNAYIFKKYILNNNLITSGKDKKLFINLTSDRSDDFYEVTGNSIMRFYNNSVELDTVVRTVLNLKI